MWSPKVFHTLCSPNISHRYIKNIKLSKLYALFSNSQDYSHMFHHLKINEAQSHCLLEIFYYLLVFLIDTLLDVNNLNIVAQ